MPNSRSFFLNYGTRGIPENGAVPPQQDIAFVEQTDEHYSAIVKSLSIANEKYYCQIKVLGTIFQPLRFTAQEFKVGEISVVVYQYGITHRAVEVTLPETNDTENNARYEKALAMAKEMNQQPYNILKNNCVTAVAATLHTLDPTITQDNLALPNVLDARVSAYANTYWTKKTGLR